MSSNWFLVYLLAGTWTCPDEDPQLNESFPAGGQSENRADSTLRDSFVEEAYSSQKPLWKHRVWGTGFIYFTINYSQQSLWIPELVTRNGSFWWH